MIPHATLSRYIKNIHHNYLVKLPEDDSVYDADVFFMRIHAI